MTKLRVTLFIILLLMSRCSEDDRGKQKEESLKTEIEKFVEEKNLVENAFSSTIQWALKSEQSIKFHYAFEEDVFRFYSLFDKYNSPLKRKVFRDSKEYKAKFDSLISFKKQLLNENHYLKFNSINEQKYDLKNNSFQVTNIITDGDLARSKSHIIFGDFVFQIPMGVKKTIEKNPPIFEGTSKELLQHIFF